MADELDREELCAQVRDQERDLVLDRFDLDDAWALGSLLRQWGVERELPIAIDITVGEHRAFHAALPGTSAHNEKWIERKKRTVREFGRSSYLVGLQFVILDPPYELETAPWMDPERYTGSGGGFPVAIRNVGVVGTIAVSGLRHDLDHALIVEALRHSKR